MNTTKPTYRPYQYEADYWKMRQFLREVFMLNNRLQRSWHVARLDYARWHTCLNCAHVSLEEVAFLWEQDDRLIAFCMPDGGRGEAHLCVHPGLRSRELEEEMLTVAEDKLAEIQGDGSHQLVVWSSSEDDLRHELLRNRGYSREGWVEHQWQRDLDDPIPDFPPAAGYHIRSLGDGLELLERCYASGLGFHEGDIKVAVENRDDSSWYRNIQNAPLYRRDLDLVAVAPDGAIAAFCTIWFDDVTRSAYFEPVATVPAHRRHGLAKAVMIEGLQRLRHMGASRAFVGGYSPEANALYQSVMGATHERDEAWLKKW